MKSEKGEECCWSIYSQVYVRNVWLDSKTKQVITHKFSTGYPVSVVKSEKEEECCWSICSQVYVRNVWLDSKTKQVINHDDDGVDIERQVLDIS